MRHSTVCAEAPPQARSLKRRRSVYSTSRWRTRGERYFERAISRSALSAERAMRGLRQVARRRRAPASGAALVSERKARHAEAAAGLAELCRVDVPNQIHD